MISLLIDVEEEEQNNDWFYVIIADIITRHNHIIESLYSMIQAKKLPLSRLLPEQPARISPMEVASSHAIISNMSEYAVCFKRKGKRLIPLFLQVARCE